EGCRKQQLGEGWFPSLEAVPKQAISMSINHILSAKALVASVPDQRKAAAVQGSLEQPISPTMPGTALRKHAKCSLHIDKAAASLLKPSTLTAKV
ncbi:MAG: glucosamine-6-phosphate deaminase, partial [Planctomycetota bacterium]